MFVMVLDLKRHMNFGRSRNNHEAEVKHIQNYRRVNLKEKTIVKTKK